MAAALEFRILGPLEVSCAGGPPVSLGGLRQRGVLAILLLHANEVVATERLVDELWADAPPARAAHTVQVFVSRLRGALGPAAPRLVTRAPGYLLQIGPDELDASRCERLYGAARAALAAGDAERAHVLLCAAEVQFQGPPLAEFTYEPFAQPTIARLLELRVSCVEERIEAALALGRHAEAIAEIRDLVHDQPFRERPRGQLMLALYRSGRQAEALDAFQQTRDVLIEELAIEPGVELRELHGAILRQDPALDLRAPAPAIEPPEPAVARAVATGVAVERKTVTVLVIALATRGRLDPEVAGRLLEAAREQAAEAVARHGGTFVSGPGNELLAVFGVPNTNEDDALRALRTADELRTTIGQLADGEPGALAVTIGVDTGEIVASTGAAASSYVGEPVSGAAQVASRSRAGDVTLTEATRRLAPDAIRVEPGPGAGDWRLRELISGAPAVRRSLDAPMVGRERELAGVLAAFERAVAGGDAHLQTVIGDAGLGKSRLALELASQLDGRATILTGRCLSYGDGIAFWPLREAIVGVSPAESREALHELLADAPDADLVAEIVAAAIGLDGRAGVGEQVPWAFRRLFDHLARRCPLVLVIEDAHWAEPPLLDLLDYLVDWLTTSPVLVLCLARPELLEARPAWGGGRPNVSSLVLAPLSDEQAMELLDNGLEDRPLAAADRARILETAEGNPLFVEQLLAMRSEDPWWDEERPISATVQSLLNARLDRLGPGERACIDCAAIVGREFWVAAVIELLPPDARASALHHLGTLVHRGLIRPDSGAMRGEEGMRFHHILIRDVAYRTIPKGLRSTLHERFADWLEPRPEGLDEFVGYHLEQAFTYRRELRRPDAGMLGLAERAAGRLTGAARRAVLRGDTNAAVKLLTRAAELFASSGNQRPDVLLDLGSALSESGDFAGAERALNLALAQCDAMGDEATTARVLIELSYRRLLIDPSTRLAEMLDVADQAIEVFRRAGDEAGLSGALFHKAQAYWTRCSGAQMEVALEQALGHAERAGDRHKRSQILSGLARATMIGPRHADDGVERCHRILERAGDDVSLIAVTEAILAVLESMRCRFDAGRRHWRESRRRLEEAGLSVTLASLQMYSGFVELMAGTAEQAEDDLTEAYTVLSSIGEHHRLPTLAAVIARVAYAQNRYGDAERYARMSGDAASEDDVVSHVMWRGTYAKVLARDGRRERAQELADAGVVRAAATDFLLLHADALADRAQVHAAAGRTAAAVDDLGRAIVLYDRKGARSGGEAAQSVRAALAAAPSRPP